MKAITRFTSLLCHKFFKHLRLHSHRGGARSTLFSYKTKYDAERGITLLTLAGRNWSRYAIYILNVPLLLWFSSLGWHYNQFPLVTAVTDAAKTLVVLSSQSGMVSRNSFFPPLRMPLILVVVALLLVMLADVYSVFSLTAQIGLLRMHVAHHVKEHWIPAYKFENKVTKEYDSRIFHNLFV